MSATHLLGPLFYSVGGHLEGAQVFIHGHLLFLLAHLRPVHKLTDSGHVIGDAVTLLFTWGETIVLLLGQGEKNSLV